MIRHFLPYPIRKRLWGDRERWGLLVDKHDPTWIEWLNRHSEIYMITQRQGVGTRVNDAGYRVMNNLNLDKKRVLEIGAGDIRHIRFWNGKPSEYILADISTKMMHLAKSKLDQSGITSQLLHLERDQPLMLEDNSVDVIVSFYSLEHLYPLRPYLENLKRVLRPGGILIGAIPAEGGLAWGTGRMLTSRRWLKKHTSIDPDKLICWEHPNFADQIISELDQLFLRSGVEYWPFRKISLIDINLIITFQYTKKDLD